MKDNMKKVSLLLGIGIQIIFFIIVVNCSDIKDNQLANDLYFTMILISSLILSILRIKYKDIDGGLICYILFFMFVMHVISFMYIF